MRMSTFQNIKNLARYLLRYVDGPPTGQVRKALFCLALVSENLYKRLIRNIRSAHALIDSRRIKPVRHHFPTPAAIASRGLF